MRFRVNFGKGKSCWGKIRDILHVWPQGQHAILGCQQVQNFVEFKTKITAVKFQHPTRGRLTKTYERESQIVLNLTDTYQ